VSDIPEVQQLGSSVLLSGLALHDARRLIVRGITEATRDGIAPHPRLRYLLTAIESAMSAVGHCDVAVDLMPQDSPQSSIGTTAAATILGLSPRQVQRIGSSLEGRRTPSRTWIFDKATVEAYGFERRRHAQQSI
jgi:hypothetical protein